MLFDKSQHQWDELIGVYVILYLFSPVDTTYTYI